MRVMLGELGLWPLVVVLCVLLFVQTLRAHRAQDKLEDVRRTSSRLIHKHHMDMHDKTLAYQALEKGADEQQESFEQEYLTWAEQKKSWESKEKSLNEDIRLLLSVADRHYTQCLPIMSESLEERDDVEAIRTYQESLDG